MDYAPFLYESYGQSDILWVEAVEAPPTPTKFPIWAVALASGAAALGLVMIVPKKRR